MAPTRNPRSMNKRFSSLNEVSPEKDGVNSNKNKQRKKKLSDKLGSQWNKEELERFYVAYRKYGKDWKKVAKVVRNRSVEMVEALYNMNRAYLSLPEGTASVVGLIAMMTDHYNVLEESDSEREINDAPGSRKHVKRKRGKIQLSVSKDADQSQSIASNDGCLSLLKRGRFDGSQPRAVGKRTPRVPVNYSYKKDYRENYVSPNKRSLKSDFDANDDEVAHVAAFALTEAAQRGSVPQISQMPYKRSDQKSTPVQSWERMHQESETVPVKFYNSSMEEECLEVSIESRGAENGEYTRDTSSLMNMEGIGTVEVHQKGKKNYAKKKRVEIVGNYLDDGGEACNGTEEGLNFSLKEKVVIEGTNAKPKHNLLFGDESSALDALQTLANLSLMIPASTLESESSAQLKEGRMIVEKAKKSTFPEGTQNIDKILPDSRQKVVHAGPGIEVSTSPKSKLERESVNDTNALFESKEHILSAYKTWKRKRKSMVSKDVDEESKADQISTLEKQLKLVMSSESSPCSDQKELGVSTAEIPLASEVILSTKIRSRHKMILQRTLMPKEKSSENILKSQPNKDLTPLQDRALVLKEKLSGCLSSYMVRRWCMFEWFYSAIDYPWFSKREFTEYLNLVGLGNIPRLCHVEWSVIKSSLGKPRRFSEHFLHEERQNLERYRESVRKHYAELLTGIRDGLPTDLAKPLYVGQRVIALHSKTREIHDGIVLTVDHDKYRVQFDRPELGVEFVMDIDCMPFNPLDNMPEALRRHIDAGKVPRVSKEPQLKGNSSFGGCMTWASSGPGEKTHTASINLAKQEKVSNALLHLRQRNNNTGNSLPPWMKPQASFNVHDGLASTLDSSLPQELGSTVIEIIRGSRLKAHAMVDAAIQALSLTKEGGDAFMRIGQLLDCIDYQKLGTNSRLPGIRSQEQVNCSFDYHSRSICCSSEPLLNDASGPKLHHDSDKVDTKIPSDLIISCVATLIMIQTCTERQYPPADVAQTLDSAVTSLHPCNPRNLPIYREIEMCMGRIKTQILALIPT
ncbi:protein ALWAYS EARLY 2-like [Gastrolobium bilobum]|uniref:protein ALWAYS EARLY 2-like n=1 Tax=Gastrolobium bilobum TaxID=150636 RepID=UPI002AB25F0F|nr:protein ALWAYS EARLY 2-like [Gastrolobium bilobum]